MRPIYVRMAPDLQRILREIEDRYQPLPEGLPSVAYIYEPGLQGSCLYISPSIERVLGFHADRCPVARTIGGCVAISTSLELHTDR